MDLVLVDDHPAVRAGLRGLIDDEDDLRVAATAGTAREGFEAIAEARPVLALLDLHLPDDDGLSLCLRTRSLPRLEPGDLPILGMLAHRVGEREVAATLGLEAEALEARRWTMLARLGPTPRRTPLVALS